MTSNNPTAPQNKSARHPESQSASQKVRATPFSHFISRPKIWHRGPRPKAHWYMCTDYNHYRYMSPVMIWKEQLLWQKGWIAINRLKLEKQGKTENLNQKMSRRISQRLARPSKDHNCIRSREVHHHLEPVENIQRERKSRENSGNGRIDGVWRVTRRAIGYRVVHTWPNS